MIIPFYTSSGNANKKGPDGKLHGVGHFFPFWGIGSTGWYNKTVATWDTGDRPVHMRPDRMDIARTNEDQTKYYGSEKLAKIGHELDELFPDYDEMNKYYLADKTEPKRSQYSLATDYKDELNQGFTKHGITPTTLPASSNNYATVPILDGNIRTAKKIIGLENDGRITYKLVSFSFNRRFARRGDHYFVLVDIKPKKKKPNNLQPVKVARTTVPIEEEKEKEEARIIAKALEEEEIQRARRQQRQQKQYVTIGRNPGGDNDE